MRDSILKVGPCASECECMHTYCLAFMYTMYLIILCSSTVLSNIPDSTVLCGLDVTN